MARIFRTPVVLLISWHAQLKFLTREQTIVGFLFKIHIVSQTLVITVEHPLSMKRRGKGLDLVQPSFLKYDWNYWRFLITQVFSRLSHQLDLFMPSLVCSKTTSSSLKEASKESWQARQ